MYTEGKLKILGKINTSGIAQALLTLDESVWEIDRRRFVNKNFSDTHTLWIREHRESHDNFLHTIDMLDLYRDCHFIEYWNTLQTQVKRLVNGTDVRSLIIRLAPGNTIHKHIDGNHNVFKYCQRIILPIISNSSPFLFYDDESFVLEDGVLYDSNGFLPHWAVNNGTSAVYTAIFDILPVDETAVVVQNHPNTPKAWAWLNENTIKKKHNNKAMEDWKQLLKEEQTRKLG